MLELLENIMNNKKEINYISKHDTVQKCVE